MTVANGSLVVGDHYFFHYSLRNDEGDSEISDEAEFLLSDYPQAPNYPNKVEQSSSLTSISLIWDLVPNTKTNVIGYQLWMDSGSDGKFNLILDGVNKPGLNYYLIQDL